VYVRLVSRSCISFASCASVIGLLLVALPNAALAHDTQQVEWQPHWRKVQPFEYVVSAALGLGSLGITLFVESPQSGHYGGILFDDAARDVFRGHSRAARNTALTVADWGYRSMLVFPFLDVAITWAIHRNTEVAWQMLAIDLEALSVAGFLGLVTTHFVRRARPSVEPCTTDPMYEAYCHRGSYSSFMSGHSVTAAVGAGVTCAHHLSMPLYGGGAGDIAACAATSLVALTTGISRLVNDRHWATDVVTAWMVGAAVGFVWPRLFHYRSRDKPDGVTYLVLPSFSPGAYSAAMIGAF